MNSYDEFADQYAALIRSRDEWGFSPYLDLVVPALLQVVGDVQNKRVLDACCGEGYFTRLLADRGAHVIGIDLSPNLIAMAEQSEAEEKRGIAYRIHDLTRPLAEHDAYFDVITCNLGLNDVADYESFIANQSRMLKCGGTLAISMNNPYSAVQRGKAKDYFDSNQSQAYSGLSSAGVPAVFYHRTLEEYMREFAKHGLCLRTLLDVKPTSAHLASGSPRPKQYYHFPFFMVLEFVRPDSRTNAQKE